MVINLRTSTLHVVLASNDSRHVSPLFRLATSISYIGHQVSFVSSLSNIKAISMDPSIPNPSNLDLVPLQGDNTAKFKEEFIKFQLEATRDVDWVLFEKSTYWVPEISKKLGIQSAYLIFESVIASAFLWPALCQPNFAKLDELMREKINSRMAHCSDEASTLLNQLFSCDAKDLPLYNRINKAITTCDVVALPSYYELDEMLPQYLERICKKRVVLFGHLQPTATNAVDNCLVNSNTIRTWLDQRVQCSVVYVAFDVEVCITSQQVRAIAYGLEKSCCPFIWVTGNPQGQQTLELSRGFEERTSTYGLVCKHWVSHANILSHPSIGGFLTNGNWGLCVEALNLGIPLIITPFTTAELHNARLIENKRLGCEVKKDTRRGVFLSSEVDEVLEIVMGGHSGGEIREHANNMRGVFGVLQYSYLTNFLNHLADMKKKMKKDEEQEEKKKEEKMKMKMKNVVDICEDSYVCSFNRCVICKDKKKSIVNVNNNKKLVVLE